MVTNTPGGVRNNKPDGDWLDLQLAEGRLFAVEAEDRPTDCLYEFNYQWDGDVSEVDHDWFKSRRRFKRECNGVAYIRDEASMYIADHEWQRITRPCMAVPIRGANVCQKHGGSIPAVIDAAKRRLQEASEIAAMRLIRLTGARDEENVRVRAQDRIAAIGSVLDRAGVKGGVEVDLKASGFERVLADLFGAEPEPEAAPDAKN
jgi:hypothetical protein